MLIEWEVEKNVGGENEIVNKHSLAHTKIIMNNKRGGGKKANFNQRKTKWLT